MAPSTKKVIVGVLVILGKAAFTGIAYGLVAKVWRMSL